MDAASMLILGVMGPFCLIGLIGIPIVLHINKKERQEAEEAEEEAEEEASRSPTP